LGRSFGRTGWRVFCEYSLFHSRQPKDALVREEGEYFWFELLGLDVFTNDDVFLGVVSEIIPAGNNEIYVVKNGDREIFLPAAEEVVNHIDLENGKMIVSILEGLLDLNEV